MAALHKLKRDSDRDRHKRQDRQGVWGTLDKESNGQEPREREDAPGVQTFRDYFCCGRNGARKATTYG